jgi:membrane-associated protein
MNTVIDICLHLDTHLNAWSESLGPWLYVLVFAVIFCETGLVVTPFLPGDSLLFAVGVLAAIPGSPLNLPLLIGLLSVAAIAGDAVNYYIGYRVGPRIFNSETSWLLNRKHLFRAQSFYEKYGSKTIVLARFMPIIRTFAPFVAGIGRMTYRRFCVYNIVGGMVWVSACLLAGYEFGEVDFVKQHFQLVVLAIVVISILPAIIEIARNYVSGKSEVPVIPGDTRVRSVPVTVPSDAKVA